MREPIENEYFNWLCAKVLPWSGTNYFALMQILHTTPFAWFVSGDRNRSDDGHELRMDFLLESRLETDREWLNEPCSVLEMLVAFSRRASFQTEMSDQDWFMEFLTNLNLDRYTRVNDTDQRIIEDILTTLVWRTYDSNGHGGMFPMRRTDRDQRKVEIWYQFCEYLEDRGLV